MRICVAILLLVTALFTFGCTDEETFKPSAGNSEVTKDVNSPKKPDTVTEKNGQRESSIDEEERDSDKKNSDTAENSPSGKQPADKSTDKQDKSKDDNTILIVAGVIGIFAIVIAALLYERSKKRKTSSPVVNVNPPPENLSRIENRRAEFRVGNLHNIGKRKEQQDSFCLSDNRDVETLQRKGLMAVVADGMGGMEGGAQISRIVTDTFLKRYDQAEEIIPADFLYDTAEASEFAVENYIERTGVVGGSTLVAVMIKGGLMNFISVGDSHIYLLSGGQLKRLNREHNYGEVLKEKAARGEVDKDEPYKNPQRHSLTAYIGMGSFHTVDKNPRPIEIRKGDKILLCSDGIYNALGLDALAYALRGEAGVAAKRIESEILAQDLPKQDNFTGVILECVQDAQGG